MPPQPASIGAAKAQFAGSAMNRVLGTSAFAPGEGTKRFTFLETSFSSCLCIASKILNGVFTETPACDKLTLKLMPQAASPATLFLHTEGETSQAGGRPNGVAQVAPL